MALLCNSTRLCLLRANFSFKALLNSVSSDCIIKLSLELGLEYSTLFIILQFVMYSGVNFDGMRSNVNLIYRFLTCAWLCVNHVITQSSCNFISKRISINSV